MTKKVPNPTKCIQVGMMSGGKWDKMHDESRRVYSEQGLSPALHTCGGGNLEPKVIGGFGEKKSNDGTQWYQQDRVYAGDVGISVTTDFNPYYQTKNLRIRKLTPKECYRLMGFDDIDADRAAKVNSNAQLYKQAGNSIVVNVLEAILTNLLINKTEDIESDLYTIDTNAEGQIAFDFDIVPNPTKEE